MSSTLMMSAAVRQQLAGVARCATAAASASSSPCAARRAASPRRRSRSPTGRARASGKSSSRDGDHHQRIRPAARAGCVVHVGSAVGMLRTSCDQLVADDDDVQRRGRARRARPRARSLRGSPCRKIAPSATSSTSVTRDRVVASSAGTNGFSMMCAVASAAESVMVMTKSVAANPSRHEDERLAAPARQPFFEHREAALAVRAERGDAVVDRQRAEQRQQHEHERRERREEAGGEERDAGLIAERREVVDAR